MTTATMDTVDYADRRRRIWAIFGSSSGNLVAVATTVLNSSNISVAGTTSGVPTVTAPNVGALTSASNTAGAGAKTEAPAAATMNIVLKVRHEVGSLLLVQTQDLNDLHLAISSAPGRHNGLSLGPDRWHGQSLAS